MYSNLKESLAAHTFSYVPQITDFAHDNCNKVYVDTIQTGIIFKKSANKFFEIVNKGICYVRTDREIKKVSKINEAYKKDLFSFESNIRAAHMDMLYFCSVIFLYENDLKLIGDLENLEDGSDISENLYLTAKRIKCFDTTDIENILLLNKLRNFLCHSTKSTIEQFFEPVIIDEIVENIRYLAELKKLIYNTHAKTFNYINVLNTLEYCPFLIESMLKTEFLLSNGCREVFAELKIREKFEKIRK